VEGGAPHRPPPPEQFVEDLSTLPLSEYGLFDRSIVVDPVRRGIQVMIGRGCPYRCTYCCNEALRDLYPRGRGHVRVPSVGYAIDRLQGLRRQYPAAGHVDFADDLPVAEKGWYLEFATACRESIGLPCRICVRAECVDEDIVDARKESGCDRSFMGLAGGHEQYRTEHLNGNHTNRTLIRASKRLRRAGIKLHTFSMVGFPFETMEQMRSRCELNRAVGPQEGVCTFFFPFPGTRLYQVCRRARLLPDERDAAGITNFHTRPAFRMTFAEEADCIRMNNKTNDCLTKPYMRTHYRPAAVRRPILFFTLFHAKKRIERMYHRHPMTGWPSRRAVLVEGYRLLRNRLRGRERMCPHARGWPVPMGRGDGGKAPAGEAARGPDRSRCNEGRA